MSVSWTVWPKKLSKPSSLIDLEKKNMKGGLNSSLDTAKELIKQLNSGDTDFAFQVRKKSYGLPFNDASIFSNHFSGHIRFFFIPFQPTSSFVYSITYKYHYQFSSVQHSGEVATHLLWTAGKWTVIFLLFFSLPLPLLPITFICTHSRDGDGNKREWEEWKWV